MSKVAQGQDAKVRFATPFGLVYRQLEFSKVEDAGSFVVVEFAGGGHGLATFLVVRTSFVSLTSSVLMRSSLNS